MKEVVEQTTQAAGFLTQLKPFLPAIFGGVIDYLNQWLRGDKKWSVVGFISHMLSAAFFGWMCFEAAIGWQYDGHIAGALSGLGGFLGVRVADLALLVFKRPK